MKYLVVNHQKTIQELIKQTFFANGRVLILRIIGSLFFIMTFTLIFGQLNPTKNKIQKAFELRIHGQGAEAIELLQQIIKIDTSNAIAYFELSRAKQEDKVLNLEKAMANDENNALYSFELANAYMLEAYMAMQMGKGEEVKQPLDKCVISLKKVLKIYPDCKESMLFLVELYSNLDQIGTKEEAVIYVDKLKLIDPVYAAEAVFTIDNIVDPVSYWKNFMDKNGKSNALLVKLGLACLNMGDTDAAKIYFDEVLSTDPEMKELYLQLARGHLYKAMRADDESRTKEIDAIRKYIAIYLDEVKEKPRAIEAWCYGWLGMLEMRGGDQEKGKILIEKAKSIDPNFSKATALPSTNGEVAPDEVTYKYKSYFRPF